jgi:hypothetical protein
MPNILGFSFMTPFYLVLLPLGLAGLFYAYRRGGKGREVLVATTFILREIAGVPKIRQKFWPPARFFLELLILIALILGAAGIASRKFEDSVVVLIDNSLSMAAKSGDIGNFRLLDLAKRDAITYLGNLSFSKGAKVCITSPNLKCLSDQTVSASEASSIIEDISIAYGEDRIEASIVSLLATEIDSQIVVFSDKQPAANATLNKRIRYRGSKELTKSLQNIAILGVKTEPGSKSGLLKVSASVVGFTDSTNQISVQLESVDEVSNEFNFTNSGVKNISVAPGETANVSFEVPKSLGYKVSIDSPKAHAFDSISDDNQVFIAPDVSAGRGLLVSNFSPRELGLHSLKNVSFDHVKPANFNSIPSNIDFAIFHNFVPKIPPTVSSLYVNPIESSALFEVEEEKFARVQPIEITSWDEINPITAYIKLPLLRLDSATPLKPKSGADVVVQSSVGPIIVSGTLQRDRYASIGFEIFPFEPRGNPVLSILTLNLIKWIAGSGVSLGYAEAPFLVSSSVGTVSKLDSSQEFESGATIFNPGLFKKSGTKADILAVNFFSASESDKLNSQKFLIPAEQKSDNANLKVDDTYAEYMILASLLLILSDLAFRSYILRIRKGRAN